MDDLAKLKKQLLAQAVRENVDVIERRLPPRAARGGRLRKAMVRTLLVVAAPVLLFISINAISIGRPGPEVVVVPPRPAPPVEPGLLTATAPRLIDPTVFQLAIRTIVLDAGHGGTDPGARHPSGLREKDVTLDIALRLRALLQTTELRAELTRDADEGLSLRDRTRIARELGGDVLVSIHVNSIPRDTRRGIETYVVGRAEDPEVEALARAENTVSGYSLSDFRKLLEGVYAGVRESESRKLAVAVQRELVRSLREKAPGVEDRGVKSAPFVVLAASEMPAILTEVSSISSDEEARRLADPAYRQGIAEALFRALRSYATARNQGTVEEGA